MGYQEDGEKLGEGDGFLAWRAAGELSSFKDAGDGYHEGALREHHRCCWAAQCVQNRARHSFCAHCLQDGCWVAEEGPPLLPTVPCRHLDARHGL